MCQSDSCQNQTYPRMSKTHDMRLYVTILRIHFLQAATNRNKHFLIEMLDCISFRFHIDFEMFRVILQSNFKRCSCKAAAASLFVTGNVCLLLLFWFLPSHTQSLSLETILLRNTMELMKSIFIFDGMPVCAHSGTV